LQYSMSKNFSFVMEIDSELETEDVQIPAFIIQPYVENVLIHAFQNTDDHKLCIRIRPQSDEYLSIEIEDNGIGRKAAAALKKESNRKSMGMDITENRIRTLHKNDNISIRIADLFDKNGQPAGTKVTLITSYEKTF
jgi:LytS/YehU family sensor histidine kinase